MTVNSKRYGRMLSDYFWREIEYYNLEEMWFQRHGGTSHTTLVNRALLLEKLSGRVISKLSNANWSERFGDLTLFDFFSWGYLKDFVYANNSQTVKRLNGNTLEAIIEILLEMCPKIVENYLKRIEAFMRCRGRLLNELVFHVQDYIFIIKKNEYLCVLFNFVFSTLNEITPDDILKWYQK